MACLLVIFLKERLLIMLPGLATRTLASIKTTKWMIDESLAQRSATHLLRERGERCTTWTVLAGVLVIAVATIVSIVF